MTETVDSTGTGAMGSVAMEFRRVARMNKHQLWSVCVAWCRDRTAAAAVLSRGLTDAWTSVRDSAPVPGAGPDLSAQLTRTVYRCVLGAASDSLAADRIRHRSQQGNTGPGAGSTLSATELSLYIMANYSALPRPVVCDLLSLPGDGAEPLKKVSQVLLRNTDGAR